jgi:hypothetical protein
MDLVEFLLLSEDKLFLLSLPLQDLGSLLFLLDPSFM